MKRGAVVIVIIVTILSAIFAIRSLKNFLDVDTCLDRGGAWEDQTSTCVGAREIHGR
jgi:hypothetical protein